MFFLSDKNNFIAVSSDQNNMFVLVKYAKCSPLLLDTYAQTHAATVYCLPLSKLFLYFHPDLIQKVCHVYRPGPL